MGVGDGGVSFVVWLWCVCDCLHEKFLPGVEQMLKDVCTGTYGFPRRLAQDMS